MELFAIETQTLRIISLCEIIHSCIPLTNEQQYRTIIKFWRQGDITETNGSKICTEYTIMKRAVLWNASLNLAPTPMGPFY